MHFATSFHLYCMCRLDRSFARDACRLVMLHVPCVNRCVSHVTVTVRARRDSVTTCFDTAHVTERTLVFVAPTKARTNGISHAIAFTEFSVTVEIRRDIRLQRRWFCADYAICSPRDLPPPCLGALIAYQWRAPFSSQITTIMRLWSKIENIFPPAEIRDAAVVIAARNVRVCMCVCAKRPQPNITRYCWVKRAQRTTKWRIILTVRWYNATVCCRAPRSEWWIDSLDINSQLILIVVVFARVIGVRLVIR